MTDTLINKVKNYEEQAIHELCSEYYPKIYRYLYYRTRTREDAEDLTHEVFIKMVNQVQYQTGNFQKWIFTIARNTLTDHYRWKAKRYQPPAETAKVSPSYEPSNDNILTQEAIKASLATLPKLQQDVIVLKYVDDFSNKQIATILSKTEGAIKLLQFRAMATLRKLMATR